MLYGTILGANVSAVCDRRQAEPPPARLPPPLRPVCQPAVGKLCPLPPPAAAAASGAAHRGSAALLPADLLPVLVRLPYRSRMTARGVALLLSASWLHGAAVCVLPLSVTASLSLCGDIIDKVYCDNFSIVKLACGNTAFINHYGLAASVVVTAAPAGLILYTYMANLRVCVGGAAAAVAARRKAVRTCAPHLASLLNFSFGCLFEVVQSRFDMSLLPAGLQVALSLYFLSGQPLLNPLLYGLSMSSVRQAFRAPPRGAHAAV